MLQSKNVVVSQPRTFSLHKTLVRPTSTRPPGSAGCFRGASNKQLPVVCLAFQTPTPTPENAASEASPSSSQSSPTVRATQQSEKQWGSPDALLSISALSLLATGLAIGPTPISPDLQQPLFIAQALGVLASIVAVHEAGHFTAARLQGIHVTKFAIGFGPPLVMFKKEEVEYSLRLFPLGGYVAFPDDDPNSPFPPDDPNLLKNRSIPERAAVISAGVIANIIFAYTILLLQAGTVGKAESAFLPGVKMPEITASSAAARAGFKDGDVVTQVEGVNIPANVSSVSKVIAVIRTSPDKQLAFTVQRKGAPDPLIVKVIPDVTPEGYGRIGVRMTPNSYINHIKADSVGDAVRIANNEFLRLSGTVLGGLKAIITNFTGVAGQLSGPVAIVAAGSEIARTDSAGLFQFCAIININLAIVNVLPLPALDGGYLLLLALEAARGKKLPVQIEQGFMASGFLLLMAAGISLIVKDTIGLIPF